MSEELTTPGNRTACPTDVALLTGAQDYHYAFGLAQSLAMVGVRIEFIGSEELDTPALRKLKGLRVLNLKGAQRAGTGKIGKVANLIRYYVRLVVYAWSAKPQVFHILWNNKFAVIDRVVLMCYYRLLGKVVILTAHNVNAARRDAYDSWTNRVTLRVQYRLAHHIFVHTRKMKRELVNDFWIQPHNITVIPYGMNNAVPVSTLSRDEARQSLHIMCEEKVLLFFGQIAPYKGLIYLIESFELLQAKSNKYRLIIAGKPKKGFEDYWTLVDQRLRSLPDSSHVLKCIQHVADADIERYFKASDVLVLPYTEIFQSGVLFLGFSFGVPVVVSDVGSLSDAISEGRTGFNCRARDAASLAAAIERFFTSELFNSGEAGRHLIREYASAYHSWASVAELTADVYARVGRF